MTDAAHQRSHETSPGGLPSAVHGRKASAEALAAELRDLPAASWSVRSRGAASSYVAFIEDEPELADIVAALWDIARSGSFPPEVSVQPGAAGTALLVHGPDFSVAARSGGPVLVASDRIRGVLRVDRDPSWATELAALISELVAVGQGAPPFDESTVPPPPPLP